MRALVDLMVDGGASQGCVDACVVARKDCRGCVDSMCQSGAVVCHTVTELGSPKQHGEDAVAWSYKSRYAGDEEPEEWDEM